jgi:hypothetical protein
MSGLIGRALRSLLEGRFDLRALNRGAVEGVPCHRADIADLEAIAPAFEGVDTVVHLAADATSPNPPWASILHNNVTGTYNVYEAARLAKVKRVVFASSGATVSGIEKDAPYSDLVAGRYEGLTSWPMLTHLSPVRPAALYGVSKVWGEALGRQFACTPRTGRRRRATSRSGAASATSCASSSAASRHPRRSATTSSSAPLATSGATETSSTRAPCWAGSPWTPPRRIVDLLPRTHPYNKET